jgi:hypothetical protein
MRTEFDQNLQQYGNMAKREMAGGKPGGDLGKLEEAFAEQRGNSVLTQEQVYKIQLQKQAIVEQVKKDLNQLRKSAKFEKVYPNGKPVSFSELTDGFVVSKSEAITWGELLTDGDWDVAYNLDATVPVEKRRQYMVEMARKQLRRLLDEQIIADESSSRKTHEWKQEAYKARGRELDETHGGLIAEKMVRNMLKKLSIDFGADFVIEDSNIYYDVEKKIDFIIHCRSRRRGVNVKASKTFRDIGVQFTTNASEKNQDRKQTQIDRVKSQFGSESPVDDVVLVAIPLSDIRETYLKWKASRKAGGPDKMWAREKKEKLVRGVLAGIIDEQEIRQACANIK